MKDGKHTILCVDDDPDIRMVLEMILSGAGYQVALAPSAEQGMLLCQELQPDLMVVDLMMEEIDAGTSLVAGVRAAGYTGPIFMLSSVGDSLQQVTDTSQLGLSGVIQKPVVPALLLRMISAKLG